jgi:hypothetical protein
MSRRIAPVALAITSLALAGWDLPDDPFALKGLPPALQEIARQLGQFGEKFPEMKPAIQQAIRDLEGMAIRVGDSYETKTKEIIDFAFDRVGQKAKLLAALNEAARLIQKDDKEGLRTKLKEIGPLVRDLIDAQPPPRLDTPTPNELPLIYT